VGRLAVKEQANRKDQQEMEWKISQYEK